MAWSAFHVCKGNLVLTDHLLEVFYLGSTDDGGSDLLRAPGERDLGHLNLLLVGELFDPGGLHPIDNSGGCRHGATHRPTIILLASLCL